MQLDRLKESMSKIYVNGSVHTNERLDAIEDAIKEIQLNGADAFREKRIAIKNYAAFGDQRCDCGPYEGPKHGQIVFTIGRVSGFEGAMGSDEIYYLECCRDFPNNLLAKDFPLVAPGAYEILTLPRALKALFEAQNSVEIFQQLFSELSKTGGGE